MNFTEFRSRGQNQSVRNSGSSIRIIDVDIHIGRYDPYGKCLVPPHPAVIAEIKRELDAAKKRDPNLKDIEFLKSIGLEPGYNPVGKDNPANIKMDSLRKGTIEMEKIDLPPFKPTGDIYALALLIDFNDNEGKTSPEHYKELLFSEGSFLTGSLRDFYKTVSNGKVNIMGQVSGWHRMPEDYSYYVGNQSGGDPDGYPHNAKRMVEDAVNVALKKDNTIKWDDYDLQKRGIIDALYVVHAGPGAEAQPTIEGRAKNIWSHKWDVQKPVKVTNKTTVAPYLTVPEDGYLGVFAHETGHLIFGWPDLYDPCPGTEDRFAGLGQWCLMAGGSWNHGGITPAYPSAWCRFVQGWTKNTRATNNMQLKLPNIEESDEVCLIPIKGKDREYFMLECRKRVKFDKYLPSEGTLMFHIDVGAENNCDQNHLAVGVVEADGQQDLQRIGIFGNQGDDGDPFPGSSNRTSVNSEGSPNTLDYEGKPTGINISNISWNGKEVTANITLG